MVRRDFTGHAEAALLGPADLLERRLCREMCNVEARAGELCELNVASDANGFGGGGHSGKTETSGGDAFAHNSTSGQRNIFRMLNDGEIERAAVVHDLPREFCGGDGLTIVGNGDDAGLLHGCDFRDGFALAACTGGADWPDADVGGSLGAVENE